ncbi:cytochrome c biogenesis protein CcdA [uncultured Ezakiella sp.]|uniref:cytochrome c biogenesis CcdA family protein n=1 Tax=uncultured Ezakiella sp. TaxID=1637529 RepID=UPI0025EDC693|nr:cytochrome c biogenesis protein CcdA [uncultured Ezakiella sp.]
MDLSLFGGFWAGFVSFISPCVLPMIPVYLMYLTGAMDVDEIGSNWKKTLVRSVAFVLGFTVVFVALGMTATALGSFMRNNKLLLQRIGGVVIILFGLAMFGLFKLPQIGGNRRMKDAGGFWSSFLMGMVFVFGMGPCAAPILGSIMMLAATKATVWKAAALLLSYSIGLGVPFILAGFFAPALMRGLKKYEKVIKIMPKIAGAILIIFGGFMLFDKLGLLFGL